MYRPSVLRWRVRREVLLLKAAGALALAVVTVLSHGDVRGMLLAGAGAVMLAVLALRDLLAPVRLTADGEGIVATKGFAGSERVPWGAVERIRVDRRVRFTSRTEFLEIETRDGLFLLSRFDLGVPVQQVADELCAFRTGL
ncbi:PH domain-containing protein [Planomonospora sp. ID82291]|uniref:PH domain-containing protein n=1 Tax=Planomonospora sp. ID82291 TaxID=2738136 RepID=UPI0018C3DFE3|nr:PH domain-containing protein [Planomonospora sp. ID82291]MBG0815181.1 PH domain-containing protein [Planomonospora sp. ID82291]